MNVIWITGIAGAVLGLALGLALGSHLNNDVVQALLTLLGVGLGWFLGVGWESLKRLSERKRMRILLRHELANNLYLLPQKRDTLKRMIEQLQRGEILPGDTVRFCTLAFTTHFATLASELPLLDRNSYHWLYENFRIIDLTMVNFAERVIGCDPENRKLVLKSYEGKLRDLVGMSLLVEEHAFKHLNGDPVDVFHTAQSFEKLQMATFKLP